MTVQRTHRAEVSTRRIAQVGSLVAAVLLGVAFWSDTQHEAGYGPQLVAFTGLVILMLVGYAMAWAPKWEAVGSVIALASVLGAFCVVDGPIHVPQSLPALGVGLPALIHLLACHFHGRVTRLAAAT